MNGAINGQWQIALRECKVRKRRCCYNIVLSKLCRQPSPGLTTDAQALDCIQRCLPTLKPEILAKVPNTTYNPPIKALGRLASFVYLFNTGVPLYCRAKSHHKDHNECGNS